MSTEAIIILLSKQKRRSKMKVTVHAAQRFLERVMNKERYSYKDVSFAMKYLSKLLTDVVPTGYATSFALPSFENYRVIYKDGSVITIIPKGEKNVH